MKPVSVFEVYTTKFSYSLFFNENLGKLDVFWKIYCSESRKSSSQQLLLEFSLFRFCFVSALLHLDCYYNEYSTKQTASLYLKLSLKLVFLVCFCYFGKDKSLLILNLFTSEYLDQIPPGNKTKKAFALKLQTENLFFII